MRHWGSSSPNPSTITMQNYLRASCKSSFIQSIFVRRRNNVGSLSGWRRVVSAAIVILIIVWAISVWVMVGTAWGRRLSPSTVVISLRVCSTRRRTRAVSRRWLRWAGNKRSWKFNLTLVICHRMIWPSHNLCQPIVMKNQYLVIKDRRFNATYSRQKAIIFLFSRC
jgi:hypothetical protein